MIVFLYIFVSLALVFWVGFPLLNTGTGATRIDELTQERTRSLLDSLSDLYASHDADKMETSDFTNIENRILLELAKIYRDQGVDPQASASKKDTCPTCHTPIKSNFQFCPSCGAVAA